MFVGEAPGADEDAQARPFVGRARRLCPADHRAIGLKREDVLIGNVKPLPPARESTSFNAGGGLHVQTSSCFAKSRPFNLKLSWCSAALPREISFSISQARNNQGARAVSETIKIVKVMPTFHPAYLLRDPTKKKRDVGRS